MKVKHRIIKANGMTKPIAPNVQTMPYAEFTIIRAFKDENGTTYYDKDDRLVYRNPKGRWCYVGDVELDVPLMVVIVNGDINW